MADYYIKKDANNEAHLWLQASVSSTNQLEVHGHPSHTLYEDTDCTKKYPSMPLIGASDEFHTSRASATIHLDPSSSGGWSFFAREKNDQDGGSATFSVPTDPNDTSTDFSVIATKTGEDPLEFDPIIRFSNAAMQQAGVPRILEGTLVSMYLEPTLHGAHGITLELAIQFDGRGLGTLILDPNRCTLDEWGDRAGCTRMAVSRHEVGVEPHHVEDPTGRDRTLYRVFSEGFEPAEVHLVAADDKERWTLVYTHDDGHRTAVPLFKAKSEDDDPAQRA